MKKFFQFFLIALAVTFAGGCSNQNTKELTVYIYDSMSWIEKGSLKKFEQDNNCKVKIVKFSSTSKIGAQLILEKKNPKADIAVGITPAILASLKNKNVLQPYKSSALKNIENNNLIFDKKFYTTPYDYGSLAIIYNPEKISDPPKTFEDLLKYKDSIIIQDPRTSSTGTDFLLWTIAAYGNKWKTFWKDFSYTVLTAAPGWSESFSKFENGEAPMMVSYATDGAYSMHNYGSYKYKALIPSNTGFIQIEGISVVKGSQNEKLAGKFIDYFLSTEIQKEIPLNQWMFPVIKTELPEAFDYAIIPEKTITLDSKEIIENKKKWISEWESIMAAKK